MGRRRLAVRSGGGDRPGLDRPRAAGCSARHSKSRPARRGNGGSGASGIPVTRTIGWTAGRRQDDVRWEEKDDVVAGEEDEQCVGTGWSGIYIPVPRALGQAGNHTSTPSCWRFFGHARRHRAGRWMSVLSTAPPPSWMRRRQRLPVAVIADGGKLSLRTRDEGGQRLAGASSRGGRKSVEFTRRHGRIQPPLAARVCDLCQTMEVAGGGRRRAGGARMRGLQRRTPIAAGGGGADLRWQPRRISARLHARDNASVAVLRPPSACSLGEGLVRASRVASPVIRPSRRFLGVRGTRDVPSAPPRAMPDRAGPAREGCADIMRGRCGRLRMRCHLPATGATAHKTALQNRHGGDGRTKPHRTSPLPRPVDDRITMCLLHHDFLFQPPRASSLFCPRPDPDTALAHRVTRPLRGRARNAVSGGPHGPSRGEAPLPPKISRSSSPMRLISLRDDLRDHSVLPPERLPLPGTGWMMEANSTSISVLPGDLSVSLWRAQE